MSVSCFLDDHQSAGSIHSVAEALLIFLEALPESVIPSMHADRALECCNNYLLSKQVRPACPHPTPPHSLSTSPPWRAGLGTCRSSRLALLSVSGHLLGILLPGVDSLCRKPSCRGEFYNPCPFLTISPSPPPPPPSRFPLC